MFALTRHAAASMIALALTALLSADALAEPLRLDDATPRWIEVSFELSPRSHPGQLDTFYGPPLRAWLEPLPQGAPQPRAAGQGTAAEHPSHLRIRIPGSSVERFLLHDDHPVPGSFSDYEWLIDTRSGEVETARLRGSVWRELDLGIARARVKADLDIALSTRAAAGFRKARRFFGLTIHSYCDPQDQASCTRVEPKALDRASGYVNAVGPIEVRSKIVSVQTFSPLGEAIFREAAGPDSAIARSAE